MIDAEGLTVTETGEDLLLQEVLRSNAFRRTASLRKLLTYLWEWRKSEISEYSIATEALGRASDFDSKFDATVRVQIGRLRRLLDKFYAEEGRHCARRITIPVGSHQLALEHVEISAEAEVTALAVPGEIQTVIPVSVALAPDEVPAPPRMLISAPLGYAILGLLLICAVLLGALLFHRGDTLRAGRHEPPLLWKQLLDNGKNTRIVLPAPVFFSWNRPNGGSLFVRDITVNDPNRWTDSPVLASLLTSPENKPTSWQGYTVASDTFASIRLARFLDGYGFRTSFSSSADTPPEIVDQENIIAFGTKNSLAEYQSDLDRLTFRMAPHEAKVADLLSPPEHPREFPLVHESGQRDVAPGIVALLPKENGSRLMLVQGSQTMALIAYMTSEEGMQELAEATRNYRTPYFEAVILSEVNRGTPLQSRLGAVRPFQDHPAQSMAKLMQMRENTR